MSKDNSPGWFGLTTSGLVVLAVPGLAQWLFPNWDAFFKFGGKWFGVVWGWLTAEWTLPAVPLVLAFLGAMVLVAKIASSSDSDSGISSNGDRWIGSPGAERKPAFSNAQMHILMKLLHAEQNQMPLGDIKWGTREPELALTVGAEELASQGLLAIAKGYLTIYTLTEAGKALTLQIWNDYQQR